MSNKNNDPTNGYIVGDAGVIILSQLVGTPFAMALIANDVITGNALLLAIGFLGAIKAMTME